MLLSLALIFISGLSAAALCKLIRLPRIIGMLAVGILLGPFVLNVLDPKILGISSELRQIALIIILIKAGLSLNIKDLKNVGRPALLMSFLPAVFEIVACVLFAPRIMGVNAVEAALTGAVLGAVSPAVVVPKMVSLIDEKLGTDKGVPQLILAGASLDDVFVIVLFSAFTGMAQGEAVSVMNFVNIPVSVVSGIALGTVTGLLASLFFKKTDGGKFEIRNSTKTVLILGTGFILMTAESLLDGKFALSGLLAVMSMACIIKMKSKDELSSSLASKFGKIWIAAEVLLFVLVGAAVDINYTLKAGVGAVIMILVALVFRSIGVIICMVGTKLNFKERLFCVIAYIPKATVQAAIGGVPLALGLSCGNAVLSLAVVSIIITAPLGAFGMDISCERLLK